MKDFEDIVSYFKKNHHVYKKISRRGYIINKNDIDNSIVSSIKKSLTVKPFVHKDYAKFAEFFPVFYEDENLLYLPRYWGLKYIGYPDDYDVGKGDTVNYKCAMKPRKNQKPMIKTILSTLKKDYGSILSVSCGMGKCVGIDTPVLMYDGHIKMVQDVKVGDQIMGDDSTPRNILSTCTGQEQLYKIIPKRGNSYIVNESHILSLRCTQKNRFGDKNDIVDISVKELLKLPKSYRGLGSPLAGYKVPVEFPDKDVELDPYIIGLWLGDGTSAGSGFSTNNHQIIKYLHKNLPKYNLYLTYTGRQYDYRIVNDKKYSKGLGSHNLFCRILRKYNLIKNKHIPHVFKCNSRENRLKLLAGLLDTDGYYAHNHYEITQKNEGLLDDIVSLSLSLGFFAHKRKVMKRCTNGKNKEKMPYYTTSITGSGMEKIPVRINRKKCSPRKQIKNVLNSLLTVEKLDVGDYYGFEIDGNRRFLLGDFTVTHNTAISLYIMCKLKARTLVVVHTSVLLNQWIERIKEFVPGASIGIIRGSKVDVEGKDVVIGMLQTLCSVNKCFPKDFFGQFKLSIWDECFPYNHFVTTNKGPIHIGKLVRSWLNKEELPLIKSYNVDKKKYEMKKMTYGWERGVEDEELIKITFYCKISVTCTKNHKFLTFNKQNNKMEYMEALLLKAKVKGSIVMGQYGKLKVKSVEYIKNEEEYLYDIEVEDNHNFLVSSTISKNSALTRNCHHLAAPTFSRAMPLVCTKYLLGLSATPKRNDQLENVFYWHLGDIGYLQEKGAYEHEVIVKCVNYHSKTYKEIKRPWNQSYNLHKMVEQIIDNKARRKFIATQIKYLSQRNRKMLVLSSRKLDLKEMKEYIDTLDISKNTPENEIIIPFLEEYLPEKICNIISLFNYVPVTTGYYIGGMKPAELEISSKCDVIFGTYHLISEGLDIPTLDSLIMMTPKKAIEQVVGRILRGKSKHIPFVIDICDQFSVYTNQGAFRAKYYRKRKYHQDIIEIRDEDYRRVLLDKKETEGVKRKPSVKRKKKKKEDRVFEAQLLIDFED